MSSVESRTELFPALVRDVEEAMDRVAKAVVDHRFLLERVLLEVQAIVEQTKGVGGKFTVQVLPVEAGWDLKNTTVHTFTLILKPKAPVGKLSDTSDRLAEAIFAVFSSVSTIGHASKDKLDPSEVNLKLRFEIQEGWSIKIIFGKGRKRVNSHTIELQFRKVEGAS
jgi:NTP-dependent ternary system trypsin peptidase co-occuring protein